MQYAHTSVKWCNVKMSSTPTNIFRSKNKGTILRITPHKTIDIACGFNRILDLCNVLNIHKNKHLNELCQHRTLQHWTFWLDVKE